MSDAPEPLRFDEFELDESNALLTRHGKAIPLPPKAFFVLCTLARRAGQLTTKDTLLDAVWGHRHVSESVLKTTISQLRTALADDAAQPRFIETVSRHGYRFIGRAATTQTAAAATVAPLMFSSPQLIGRQTALAQLRQVWNEALAGRQQLAWVVGDAGIGKTTLVESFLTQADPVVARGQCVDDYGAGEPMRPVLEAIGALCRRFPDLPALMRTVAPTWLVQFPWLLSAEDRSVLERELSGAQQERMLRECAELLARFTQQQPLVIVIEDLHWSDHATLRLLAYFARRRDNSRLLWLGSFRLAQVLAEDHPLVPLRQELRLHRLCTEIALDAFTEQEVADYIESRMPGECLPEAAIKQLHSHTDGLPLFLANVIDMVLARGGGDVEARRLHGAGDLPVPDTLAGAIERQISGLSNDARTLLEAASVCGMEFRVSTLADALNADIDKIAAQCEELTRRRFWLLDTDIATLRDGSLDARISFRHALYRHVFYGRIGATQRALYHRRIAQSIERDVVNDSDATPTALASHYEKGHDFERALRYYAAAAKRALSHFAAREAVDLTAHALTLLSRCPESATRLEIELELLSHRGLACSVVFGLGASETSSAFERARSLCEQLPQTPERMMLLSGMSWMLYTLGNYEEALAVVRRAHSLAHDANVSVYVCNIAGMTVATQGDHVSACEWLERGIATWNEGNDRAPISAFLMDPEVSMRAVIAMPLMCLGFIDRARSHSARAIERAQKLGQPMAHSLSLKCAIQLEVRLGDIERVAALLEQFEAIVRKASVTQALGPLHWFKGWLAAHRGDTRTGLELILQGYGLHERFAMFATCTEVLGYAAQALILENNWSGAEQQLTAAFRLAERLGEYLIAPELHLLQATVYQGRSDMKNAMQSWRKALDLARSQQALAYEVKALTAIAARTKARDDLAALRNTFDRIQEGRDAPLYAKTRELVAARAR